VSEPRVLEWNHDGKQYVLHADGRLSQMTKLGRHVQVTDRRGSCPILAALVLAVEEMPCECTFEEGFPIQRDEECARCKALREAGYVGR